MVRVAMLDASSEDTHHDTEELVDVEHALNHINFDTLTDNFGPYIVEQHSGFANLDLRALLLEDQDVPAEWAESYVVGQR